MSKKSRLIHECKTLLKKQTRYGQSKHKDKILQKQECKSNQTPKGIYSTSTYKTYDETCRSFIKWIMENHNSQVKTYLDCKQFASEWLRTKENKGLSAWSLHLYGNALSSSFGGLSKSELGYNFPVRERKNIKRNRDDNLNRSYTSKYQKNAVEMLKATGCRRAELLRLRKTDFRKQINKDGNETGNLEVFKRGKGGIERWCMVNPNYTNFVTEFLAQSETYNFANEERIFKKKHIPNDGIHSARAYYARDLYDYYETMGFGTGNLYFCRKELVGVYYDKGILEKVSYDLQHSRNNIVINYLWMTQ